jgi:hypothetical protein
LALADGFDVPTATEMGQWREVVGQMMEGECDTISLSGYGWGSDFTVRIRAIIAGCAGRIT